MKRQYAMTAYVASVIVVAGCTGWYFYTGGKFSTTQPALVVAFVLLALITEALPVQLPRAGGTVSVSFAVIYASVLLFGPGVGFIMGIFGTISLEQIRHAPPLMLVFNRAQLSLSAAASGLVFMALGGVPGHFLNAGVVLPVILGGGTYFIINATLATIAISMRQKLPAWQTWVLNVRWTTPHYLALVPLAFLIAVSYNTLGVLGLIAFFLPLLVARYSFQRYMDMREIFLDTISSLAKALEAKDPYTRGHADRVSAISVEVARKMGWSETDVELIKYVGVLHDIGKIGIGDEILKKPGRFTQEEYEQMKQHAAIGAEIIKDIKLLGKGAQWVRHHHEWYNGRGYPDGLAGNDIPEGARIMAVGDAFDAMISHRPYKRARTIEEARREIEDYSGTQFDPDVVKAFLLVTTRPEVVAEIQRLSPTLVTDKGS